MNALVRLLNRLLRVASDYRRLTSEESERHCHCVHPLMLDQSIYCSICGKPRKWWAAR